jgi:hypothetical protein
MVPPLPPPLSVSLITKTPELAGVCEHGRAASGAEVMRSLRGVRILAN